MKHTLFYVHVLENLHVGTGQGTGIIDLPLAREVSTGLPVVPGSGLKGALRYELGEPVQALFGTEAVAGLAALADARLLCLPVRSWYGTFAWLTCPLILRRYVRAKNDTGSTLPVTIPDPDENTILCDPQSDLLLGQKAILDELAFTSANTNDGSIQTIAAEIARDVFGGPPEKMPDQPSAGESGKKLGGDVGWNAMFQKRFAVVADSVFVWFAENATEVRARIAIDSDTGAVQDGALWYEESLPPETLLYGVIAAEQRGSKTNPFQDLPTEIRMQMGGHWSTGEGQVRWIRKGA